MHLKPGLNGVAGADSDSGRSPSDDEKAIGHGHIAHPHADLPPDPDEHLSPEEKAKIVSSLNSEISYLHLFS
jgi:hypothetical protein